MCSKSGPHLQEVDNALQLSTFKGVALHNGSKCDVLINRGQFFRSLAENMKNRLLTFQSSHASTSDNSDAVHYHTFVDQLKVLYPDNWPDELTASTSALYGQDEITALAERFGVNARQSVQPFRDYLDNGGKRTPDDLKPLLLAVDTVPVCTAECERGFSQMNLIMSPTMGVASRGQGEGSSCPRALALAPQLPPGIFCVFVSALRPPSPDPSKLPLPGQLGQAIVF